MKPAIPFALLGVVQLFAVAAWIGLAGAGLFPRLRRRVTPVFVLGALLLAAADALTAVSFGDVTAAAPMWLRVAGFALLAVGLAGGSLRTFIPATGAAAVAVPLGAPPAPALIAGVAGVAAAASAVRARGHPPGARSALAAGLVLAAVAAALGVVADTSLAAALAVQAVRAGSAAALVITLVLLARASVLGKVVTAILAGIVVMAVAAVGVVGTAVAGAVQQEQARQLRDVAQGQRTALQSLGSSQAVPFAQVAAQCANGNLGLCAQTLSYYASEPTIFAARVDRDGGLTMITKGQDSQLAPAARQSLAGQPLVDSVLHGGAAASAITVLPDRSPAAVVLGVAPQPGCTPAQLRQAKTSECVAPGAKTPYVAVYGIRLGDKYAGGVHGRISLGYSLLADGHVLASSLTRQDRRRLVRAARQAGVFGQPVAARDGLGVEAVGDAPEVRFLPLSGGNSDVGQVATLAISRPAAEALAAQRALQRRLFVTALVVLVVVAAFALLLGDRLVDPVRRLTVAAGRIRRGDLTATGGVQSRDEMGALSRAFDGMTAALRAQAEREREVERMKTEFLANVSHELRTPLTPIRGYAELLRQRDRLRPGQAAEFADAIVSSSRRMGRVVDLLVDVAALEAGRVQPMPRPVPVGAYVDERLADWRSRWPQRAGDLTRRVAGGLPDVLIDPAWIAKAFDELADNAVKHTMPGTRITLTAASVRAHGDASPVGGAANGLPRGSDGRPESKEAVRLTVRDAGGGLSADDLPVLLGDFTQADASATRPVGGMGLGLSFVRRLANRFGLQFVASAGTGTGAEFGLDLPVVTDPATTNGARRPRGRRAASDRRRSPSQRAGSA
jgi:signal transduction histidine kinase